jgi:hypothetical protein
MEVMNILESPEMEEYKEYQKANGAHKKDLRQVIPSIKKKEEAKKNELYEE